MRLKKGWVKASKQLPKIHEEVSVVCDGTICDAIRINKDEFVLVDDDWVVSNKEIFAWKSNKK